MGHWCRICGSERPNEQFTGRGHRDRVCRVCQRLPKKEREAIEISIELHRFLDQSNISKKNRKRLAEVVGSQTGENAELAELILEVAAVKPHKKRRLKFLARHHPELLMRLKEKHLIASEYDYDGSYPEECSRPERPPPPDELFYAARMAPEVRAVEESELPF